MSNCTRFCTHSHTTQLEEIAFIPAVSVHNLPNFVADEGDVFQKKKEHYGHQKQLRESPVLETLEKREGVPCVFTKMSFNLKLVGKTVQDY